METTYGNTDVSSPAASVGFSLIEASDVMALTSTGPNIIGVDPQLDALGPHGGQTETHQPAGTVPRSTRARSSGLTVDQRGLARTADFDSVANAAGGDGTDIGSLERDLLEPGPGPIVGQAKSGRLCLGERATIIGTRGKDKLRGTPDRDVISGKRGNDTIVGLEGNDLICGDKGKDRIKGGGGDDTVRGGNGGDLVRGGAGDDTLRGGGGPDSLFGDGGSDALFGGSASGGRGQGRSAGSGAVNRCDGGEGTDAATGCEIVEFKYLSSDDSVERALLRRRELSITASSQPSSLRALRRCRSAVTFMWVPQPFSASSTSIRPGSPPLDCLPDQAAAVLALDDLDLGRAARAGRTSAPACARAGRSAPTAREAT